MQCLAMNNSSRSIWDQISLNIIQFTQEDSWKYFFGAIINILWSYGQSLLIFYVVFECNKQLSLFLWWEMKYKTDTQTDTWPFGDKNVFYCCSCLSIYRVAFCTGTPAVSPKLTEVTSFMIHFVFLSFNCLFSFKWKV